MSSSELSELSSSPLTDDDELERKIPKGKLDYYFNVGASALPPKLKKKRAPSPPHEYVLADNPDIAVRITGKRQPLLLCPKAPCACADLSHTQFICMFRSRFSNAFSKSLPHYGPQDIERGVVDSTPGEHVERLLCALLGLLLNRKKEVEYVSTMLRLSSHINYMHSIVLQANVCVCHQERTLFTRSRGSYCSKQKSMGRQVGEQKSIAWRGQLQQHEPRATCRSSHCVISQRRLLTSDSAHTAADTDTLVTGLFRCDQSHDQRLI